MGLFYYLGGKSGSAGSRRPVKTTIGVNDRVSVFLELAEAHRLLGNQVYIAYYLLILLLSSANHLMG